MIRLLVADDHEAIRYGLQTLIADQPDITLIGTAADGRTAVTMAIANPPDVILMDLSMPILDGVAATREITLAAPTVQILVLTSSAQETTIRKAFAAGARGYLLKDTPPHTLLNAIRAIHRGETPMTPTIQDVMSTRADLSAKANWWTGPLWERLIGHRAEYRPAVWVTPNKARPISWFDPRPSVTSARLGLDIG